MAARPAWERLKALIVKELLAVWLDPKGRAILIVPPVLQLLLFSFAATLEVRNVHLAVVNQDSGRWGHELVARFEGAQTFSRLYHLDSVQQIKPLIDRQTVLGAVHIGPEFSRRIEAGRPADVQIILDGRRSNAAQILNGYIGAMILELNRDLEQRAGQPPPQSTLVARNWFNPNLEYIWFTVPCLVGMIALLVSMTVTALSVARERELGTFEQLLVSPLRPREILLGKTIPPLLIGLVHGTLYIIIAVVAFRIPLAGSLFLLYPSLVIYLAAVVGVGLFISSLSNTQQQAMLGGFIFAAPAILLSGFAAPVENMPDWLQTLTLINPLRHFLVVVLGIFLRDMPADDVLWNTLPLIPIAAVTLTAAAWLFRRRMA